MAITQVFVGQSVLLLPEDQRHAVICLDQLATQIRGQEYILLLLDPSAVCRANDKSAIVDGLSQILNHARVSQQVLGFYRRNCFSPDRGIRRDDDEFIEPEVFHSPRRGADVVRIARANENDFAIFLQFRSSLLRRLRNHIPAENVITLVQWIEGDPLLLQIRILAEVRGQRRAVAADDVGIRKPS